MAEGVFRSLTSKPPYNTLVNHVDSAGTGAYHTGDTPDSRTLSTLEDYGITDYVHHARKIQPSDFNKFDYIFAMDRQNFLDIQRMSQRVGGGKAKIMLFGEFSGTKRPEVVEDPYYGGRDGFEVAYEQCMRFSKNFLKRTFPDVNP